jgi:broad specificity phosphatase PhoE
MQYGSETLEMLTEIMDQGVNHVALLMRHSARTYNEGNHDHDNRLTDEGREFALEFGKALPKSITLRGYTSPVNRCQETAQLILEGHHAEGGPVTRSRIIDALGNFYILDMMKLSRAVEAAGGMASLYTSWFDGKCDPDMIISSEITAKILTQVVTEKLSRPLANPQVDLLVSHDMNLYPVREHLLNQSIAEFGDVNYLDAIAFYFIDDTPMMRSHHNPAVPVSI